ncbi:MAG: hypothetical protein ACLPIG_09545, partial [Methylocella sp.]
FIAEGHDEFLYGGLVPGHESAPSLGTAPSSQRMAAESMTGPTRNSAKFRTPGRLALVFPATY